MNERMKILVTAGKGFIRSAVSQRALGWQPTHTFETGRRETIPWYLDNQAWRQPLRDKRATERVRSRT